MSVDVDRSGVNQWRFTCPRGHIRWEQHETGVWCVSCDRSPLFDGGRYEVIIDQKERTELPIDEVRLV
ncbi:hypothetical protein BJ1_gp19 [Halorubrum virus BJ1]|uniref:Uncharacterized protein n=1 Tax=Halorubrum virus BJ1 TaxID=416419 RepID=A0ZYN2_9CAUD|nr:hypothetical protein BJ1_gp19 [Halorubrum virus BJ1]CAL92441.1 hypothetical protein [Halorubrum virus BJ1]